MNISATLTEKKNKNIALKNNYGLIQKFKPLGLIQLSNIEVTHKLIEGLKVLSASFVIVIDNAKYEKISKNIIITNSIDSDSLIGFDFIVSDNSILHISEYTSLGITPIINKGNHLSSILKEFNPMKNQWNSFYYDESDHWCIFYTIVRYMENYKFPFDNKNLVKNVLAI